MRRFLIASLFLCLCNCLLRIAPVGTQAAESDAIQPDLPYQAVRLDPVQYDVDFSVVVTAPYQCKVLKVWLPLPQTDVAQEISDSCLTAFPVEVEPKIGVESTFGNKFAYFEFANPRGGQIIRHRLKARVWELRWNLKPSQVVAISEWPDSFAPYLRPQRLSDEGAFTETLREITPQATASVDNLYRAMTWVDQNLTYDHVNASLQADAGTMPLPNGEGTAATITACVRPWGEH